MFGDHIASAMARERQRDLVPELREVDDERSGFGVEDGAARRLAVSWPWAVPRRLPWLPPRYRRGAP